MVLEEGLNAIEAQISCAKLSRGIAGKHLRISQEEVPAIKHTLHVDNDVLRTALDERVVAEGLHQLRA
eukprot:CAMPEP_0183477440 /NCGR_PEP_ID=MMETSP0370-20130417/168213_1 /TAXON_ID=268820 /ORGANISM="Peridinium aciculiferum, Strain PAER-2" /LENGTH=67 /DNA_ID=CAMNT_0025670341 /DNA_START=489 /DNA_END=688 /DNA_ORIENTATION=+